MNAKQIIKQLLDKVDIKIGGGRPFDIQVYDERFYQRVLSFGSLGLGEAYMDGWWDCPELDSFFAKVLAGDLESEVKQSWPLLIRLLWRRAFNMQSKFHARKVAAVHYDLDTELFEMMLGETMAYSCGYWICAVNLHHAQQNKFRLICEKLQLQQGMSLLDIGCGFGSLLKYATENYRVRTVGITISKEQARFAEKQTKGLPIEIIVSDYRDIDIREKFDRVVSVGMFEHVGPKNYRKFFEVVKKHLADDGLFLLHTIGSNDSLRECDPWFDKYIFPGGVIPSAAQITKAAEDLVMEDWHNFGADYDKTLLAWCKNFTYGWGYRSGEPFFRMWRYYLLSSAGAFRARRKQIWQIVFSKNGVPGGYPSIR